MNSEEKLIENEALKEAKTENIDLEHTQKVEREEIISDFAPEPIKIPNYNVKKELKKHDKGKKRDLKRNSEQSKKTRKILKKIVSIVSATVFFILIFTVLTATLASILVKFNTTEHAIEIAIKNHEPENFIIGKIKSVDKLNIKPSAKNATLTDILRDNAMGSITYADIEMAISKSTYSDFIAKHTHGVISFLLYGTEYRGMTGSSVSEVLLKNSSYIKLVTGVELGESACREFGAYVDSSSAFDDIKPMSLINTKLSQYTEYTSVVFSFMVLVCLIVSLMLLIVLSSVICRRAAHIVIGWSAVFSGVASVVGGFLFKLSFETSSVFIQNVIEALNKSFSTSMFVFGGVVCGIGILVLLIGKVINDGYYDEEITEE